MRHREPLRWSLQFSQITAWREFPGYSAERGTQAEPGSLPEARRWSCEFREAKRGRVFRESARKKEVAQEKISGALQKLSLNI